MNTELIADLPCSITPEPFDRTRYALTADGVVVCSLSVDRMRISDGDGDAIDVGGIGNVETDVSHRRRGLAEGLLRRAIQDMRHARLAGSLLYGIDHYYERFGWRTCGESHRLIAHVAAPGPAGVGSAATARTATARDLPAIAALHAADARRTRGAVHRPADGRTWSMLASDTDTCRVVVDADGSIIGYAWLCPGHHNVRELQTDEPTALVIAEIVARDDAAASAVADAADAWAREGDHDGAGARWTTSISPHSALYRHLTTTRNVDAVRSIRPHGGIMWLPLDHEGRQLADCFQHLPDRF